MHYQLHTMKNNIVFNVLLFSFLSFFSAEILQAQTGSVTVNADPRVDELLTLKKDLEKDNKLSDGYTIQLYYGEFNKSNDILKRYRSAHSTWPASLEYETPNYKVWVGNFATRLEADRALMEIQRNFESAFILEKKK